MHLVLLAQDMAGQRIALLADQANPAGQTQYHQHAPGGFMAGFLAQRNGREVAAQLAEAG